ncbi:MAG: BLUF domain-containing protein [Acidobacteria bacterium]|jgi:hypothetical protein|nr:BLUF domain-containing protein [Acidobacteriota bacterium]
MFFLVYVSVAQENVSKEDLLDILTKSREANAAAGITGMLLYKDGHFMQALEGEETAVRDLYARISRDPRHLGLRTLVEGRRERRSFGDWSMGFQDLSSPEARATPGYSEFMNMPLTAEEFSKNPGQCERLLWAFKRGE